MNRYKKDRFVLFLDSLTTIITILKYLCLIAYILLYILYSLYSVSYIICEAAMPRSSEATMPIRLPTGS